MGALPRGANASRGDHLRCSTSGPRPCSRPSRDPEDGEVAAFARLVRTPSCASPAPAAPTSGTSTPCSWEADPAAAARARRTIRRLARRGLAAARTSASRARRAAAADASGPSPRGGRRGSSRTFEIALASTLLSVPARERTKATCVCVVNEVRHRGARARPPRRRGRPLREAGGRHDAAVRRARGVRREPGVLRAAHRLPARPTTRSCSRSSRRSSSPRTRPRSRSGRVASASPRPPCSRGSMLHGLGGSAGSLHRTGLRHHRPVDMARGARARRRPRRPLHRCCMDPAVPHRRCGRRRHRCDEQPRCRRQPRARHPLRALGHRRHRAAPAGGMEVTVDGNAGTVTVVAHRGRRGRLATS